MKVLKILSALFFLVGVSDSYACYSDYDCGYGNKCVKPQGSYALEGTCVMPVDQFGNRTYKPQKVDYKPTEVMKCSWDTQCGIGGTCFKKSGALYGICVK